MAKHLMHRVNDSRTEIKEVWLDGPNTSGTYNLHYNTKNNSGAHDTDAAGLDLYLDIDEDKITIKRNGTKDKRYIHSNGIYFSSNGRFTDIEDEKKEKAEKEAKNDRKKSKGKKCRLCSCFGSICDAIIDSIPGLRCIVDCCC